MMMKKILPLYFLTLVITPLSFGQIFRCEAEGKNGPQIVSLYFLDFANYRYMLYTEEVNIFLEEDNIAQLKTVLEKFVNWETIALEGQVSLTKTIDSITFSGFYHSRTFFREPIIFYFIFTGSLLEAADGPLPHYTLFVDTNMDKIAPFRLSGDQVQELLESLSPEKLAEARETYEQQKAMEELFK